MIRKTSLILAVALGAVSVGTVAIAANPAKTIEAREANFKTIGKSFKAIIDQMKAPTPDMKVVQTNADAIAKLAPKVGSWFPKGSGPESGVKTHALAAIWEKPADFKAAAAKLAEGAKAMQTAAKTGKIEAVKAAFPGLGGACKGCHDQFKARD